MRALNRNKVRFFYSNYENSTEIIDEWGNNTGQYQGEYSTPVECWANISASKGTTDVEVFGIAMNYDKVMMADSEAPITETTILWIDKLPETPFNSSAPKHDYIVKRVAKSLNGIAIAIRRVEVS